MKNWVLHILYIGIATLTLASCAQDELLPMPDANKMQVVFTLALGDSSPRSRATSSWEQNEGGSDSTIGNGIDNEIGLNQLQVILYNNDGTFLGKVNNLQYYRTEQANVYQFVGNLSMNTQQELNCKIMVFANLGVDNIISEETDLPKLGFSYDSQYIPMWGVSSINVTVTPGKQTVLEKPIYLLRAMAKVEVALDEKLVSEGYSLNNVTLKNYNTSGYCLPVGYKDVSSTEGLDTERVFNVYSSLEENQTLSFRKNEDKSYTIYVPEYQNALANGTASQMKVTIKDKVYNLDFKYYDTGEAFNLVRNHYYKFNIKSIAPDGIEGQLYYKVVDWDCENVEIGFN